MPDIDPAAPTPEVGSPGAEGEGGSEGKGGSDEGVGGAGGTGGTGGRGGRGGDRGARGATGATGAAGDRQTLLNKVAVGLCVLIVGGTGIYYAAGAQNRLNQTGAALSSLASLGRQLNAQIACDQVVVVRTVAALRARSDLAKRQADVTLILSKAQRHYLHTVVRPGITRPQQAAALQRYVHALNINIHITNSQLRVRAGHPYPALSDVKACQR